MQNAERRSVSKQYSQLSAGGNVKVPAAWALPPSPSLSKYAWLVLTVSSSSEPEHEQSQEGKISLQINMQCVTWVLAVCWCSQRARGWCLRKRITAGQHRADSPQPALPATIWPRCCNWWCIRCWCKITHFPSPVSIMQVGPALGDIWSRSRRLQEFVFRGLPLPKPVCPHVLGVAVANGDGMYSLPCRGRGSWIIVFPEETAQGQVLEGKVKGEGSFMTPAWPEWFYTPADN